MIYLVEATFDYSRASEFYLKLTDGSIRQQRPDGEEIVNAMGRAVIGHQGDILWTERCYCATPLQHERATVYDHYFTDFKTEPIDRHRLLEGQSFLKRLASIADQG